MSPCVRYVFVAAENVLGIRMPLFLYIRQGQAISCRRSRRILGGRRTALPVSGQKNRPRVLQKNRPRVLKDKKKEAQTEPLEAKQKDF